MWKSHHKNLDHILNGFPMDQPRHGLFCPGSGTACLVSLVSQQTRDLYGFIMDYA
jgi:hypothetical protein